MLFFIVLILWVWGMNAFLDGKILGAKKELH